MCPGSRTTSKLKYKDVSQKDMSEKGREKSQMLLRKKTAGRLLRGCRIIKCYTLAQTAKKTGVTRTHYISYEKGRTAIPERLYPVLREELDFVPEVLYAGELTGDILHFIEGYADALTRERELRRTPLLEELTSFITEMHRTHPKGWKNFFNPFMMLINEYMKMYRKTTAA